MLDTCDIALQEAARIINVMREKGVCQADEESILDWSDATAARGSRQPQPALGLELLQLLELARPDKTRQIVFDRSIVPALAEPALYIDRMPQDVMRVLLHRMMATTALRKEITKVLRFCTIDANRAQVEWTTVPPEVLSNPAWLWLQRVGSAVQAPNGLVFDAALLPYVAEIRDPSIPLSQAALDARLDLQRYRAGLAEDYIVRLEKERLVRLGAGHFAEAVERVSVNDACAGYDIQSFDVTGEPRLIEVKCSAGFRDRFFISDNERKIATANGDSYWLAWVGWAANLPDSTPEVCWIKNLAGAIEASPSQWKISACDTVVELVSDDTALQTSP